MLMAVDPSSTTTGWAVMDGDANVLGGGVIKPPQSQALLLRVSDMDRALSAAIASAGVTRAIVEVPNTHTHGRKKRAAGYGAANYGMAVGYLVHGLMLRLGHDAVHVATASEWTRGTPKRKRLALVKVRWPEYAEYADRDKGLDLADAVGLGLWFTQTKRMRKT